MNIGNNLIEVRKKAQLSQEEVANKLKVSRQTISKWELGETIPDAIKTKKLADIYNVSLDELVDDDKVLKEIKEVISRTNFNNVNETNWTNVWSKKYPVLKTYKEKVDVNKYKIEIRKLLKDLMDEYGYSELDAMLVFKDILAHNYKNIK